MSGLSDGSSPLLAERRAQTIARINELQQLLAPLEDISIRPFCVYATAPSAAWKSPPTATWICSSSVRS